MTTYVADLGPEDRLNSGGVRLTSFAAIVAQDRANVHRFGIRHRYDQVDDIFFDRAMRAQIASAVDVRGLPPVYINNVVSGAATGTYLVVQVYGLPGRVSRITFQIPG